MPFLFVILLSLLSLCNIAWASDWQLSKTDNKRQIQVYTRSQESSPYDEFYAKTVVAQPIDTVVAVLSDVSAWPQWLARLKLVKVLEKKPNQFWLYSVYKLPYPFVERDAILHTLLMREPKTGVVRVEVEALANYTLSLPIEVKRVRMTNLQSTWRLTPLAKGGTLIELSGRGEPEGLMPALIFNYNLADEPQQTLRLLRQMLLRPQYQTGLKKPS
ncbi:SRPBCC family protein [Agitococcus lubricus]|uniref:Polyketide cyclase/dehydrase/lipid transport protein n=1 Tax=Agitococcus lubricus TaxID=1077255 RepID=A0A2T5IY76_9GAMM|nr:SRPBCC family protein [Agitococcus lubricus]PTQ88936.1 polyketide cyclase/dehydrase/lipid transport protein [Agitococcus lubricus]